MKRAVWKLEFVNLNEDDFTDNDKKLLELNALDLDINEDMSVDTSQGIVKIQYVDSEIEDNIIYMEVGVYRE